MRIWITHFFTLAMTVSAAQARAQNYGCQKNANGVCVYSETSVIDPKAVAAILGQHTVAIRPLVSLAGRNMASNVLRNLESMNGYCLGTSEEAQKIEAAQAAAVVAQVAASKNGGMADVAAASQANQTAVVTSASQQADRCQNALEVCGQLSNRSLSLLSQHLQTAAHDSREVQNTQRDISSVQNMREQCESKYGAVIRSAKETRNQGLKGLGEATRVRKQVTN